MFEEHQVSSQYQACSLPACLLSTTTAIWSSSYYEANVCSSACAQMAAVYQLLREKAKHWKLNGKTVPELV